MPSSDLEVATSDTATGPQGLPQSLDSDPGAERSEQSCLPYFQGALRPCGDLDWPGARDLGRRGSAASMENDGFCTCSIQDVLRNNCSRAKLDRAVTMLYPDPRCESPEFYHG